jgi:hypothetical protein
MSSPKGIRVWLGRMGDLEEIVELNNGGERKIK